MPAQLRPGKGASLVEAINSRKLGAGSVAGDEYVHDMDQARRMDDGSVCWLETCFCPTTLLEERSYWEEHFELTLVKEAHARSKCLDANGTERWASVACNCTDKLEAKTRELYTVLPRAETHPFFVRRF